jgi:hypothetical protein
MGCLGGDVDFIAAQPLGAVGDDVINELPVEAVLSAPAR